MLRLLKLRQQNRQLAVNGGVDAALRASYHMYTSSLQSSDKVSQTGARTVTTTDEK